jgi:hypothetical protein
MTVHRANTMTALNLAASITVKLVKGCMDVHSNQHYVLLAVGVQVLTSVRVLRSSRPFILMKLWYDCVPQNSCTSSLNFASAAASVNMKTCSSD